MTNLQNKFIVLVFDFKLLQLRIFIKFTLIKEAMDPIEKIHNNLDRFIRRYYLSALLKGTLLFFTSLIVYILFWVFIEYFFWMPKYGRGVVFWVFITLALFLSYNLIIKPLLKYFSILKGIDYESASRIIGEALPGIDDKLLNTILLSNME